MSQIKTWIFAALCSAAFAVPATVSFPSTQNERMKDGREPLRASNVTAEPGKDENSTGAEGSTTSEYNAKLVAFLQSSQSSRGSQNTIRPLARGLLPSMEMLDSKRRPEPKKPMGNDIGIARKLVPAEGELSQTSDKFEAEMSVGFATPGVNDAAKKLKVTAEEEETAAVSREMHALIDAIPKVSSLHLSNVEFEKDPEEEAINQRITEVARQLAENAMRKEYEEGKLGHILPLPKATPKDTQPDSLQKVIRVSTTDNKKLGRSLAGSNTLPLVSHMPSSFSQLQLITDIQQIPQLMIREGFYPVTPPPELSGPILGGPPLKTEDENTGQRSARADRTNYLQDTDDYRKSVELKIPTYIVLGVTRL